MNHLNCLRILARLQFPHGEITILGGMRKQSPRAFGPLQAPRGLGILDHLDHNNIPTTLIDPQMVDLHLPAPRRAGDSRLAKEPLLQTLRYR